MRPENPRLKQARSELLTLLREGTDTIEAISDLCCRFADLEEELRSWASDYESSVRITSLFEQLVRGSGLPAGRFDRELHRPVAEATRALTRLRTLREIGRGGMGTVEEVWDPELDRVVARKVQRGAPHEDDLFSRLAFERSRARVLREARVMARLDHPGVVPLHELGLDADGRACFTMQLVRGCDLRTVIDAVHARDPRWPLRTALRTLVSAAETVHHAHEQGVLHRDLKPHNIMVGEHGETYVMDWGLAWVCDERSADVGHGRPSEDGDARQGGRPDLLFTVDGEAVGTPAYMSPEQASGRSGRASEASDVYGLGAILYHLITGRPPYADRFAGRPTAPEVLEALSAGPPSPPGSGALGRQDLWSICARAMARESGERYPTAGALADDLRAYLGHHAVAAFRAAPLHRLHKWLRRNLAGIAAVGAPALLLATGVVGMLVDARAARDDARMLAAEAEEGRLRADAEAARAHARLAVLEDLDLAAELRSLSQEASSLWPAYPSTVERMRAWVTRAAAAAGRLPALERRLAEWSGANTLEMRALQRVATSLRDLVTPPDEAPPSLGVRGASLPAVRRRIRLAEHTGREMAESRAAWRAVLEDVALPEGAYGGLTLTPRPGLVPLECDPSTGLWEFWHVQSGERPVRSQGPLPGWEVHPATGLVLVLLPGGWTQVGTDDDDELAEPHERPTVELELEPFYLSKYEMTQGQWLRLAGADPSTHRRETAAGPDLTLPVESVSWEEAHDVLTRFDLELPSEARWELAARGGELARWHVGPDPDALRDFANLADETRRSLEPGDQDLLPWDDGFPEAAPVGSFLPNGFGFYDVQGNVREWCGDGFKPYSDGGFAPGTGLRDVVDVNGRIARGAGYRDGLRAARTTRRMTFKKDHRSPFLGLRPALSLAGSQR